MVRPARDVDAEVAPARVVLELSTGTAQGFLFSGFGHVATSLHAVAGTTFVRALLADGRRFEIHDVIGLDPTRDLLVLHLEADALPYVKLQPEPLPDEGARALVAGRDAPLETTIAHVRVLNPDLTVFELGRALDEACSGAPICDADGQVIALATAARSAESGPVGLGIPARYLVPYLAKTERVPIEKLARRARRRRAEHPLSLLDGAPRDSLEDIARELVKAISVGAPTYNAGDHEGCYRIYARTAELLCERRCDCPGPAVALHEGLDAAAKLSDPDAQAWAMRDTFDALLDVIAKKLGVCDKKPALRVVKKEDLN